MIGKDCRKGGQSYIENYEFGLCGKTYNLHSALFQSS